MAQSAIVIQSFFRCMAAKRHLRHARKQATRIQAAWRGVLGRRLALEVRNQKEKISLTFFVLVSSTCSLRPCMIPLDVHCNSIHAQFKLHIGTLHLMPCIEVYYCLVGQSVMSTFGMHNMLPSK